MNVWLNIYNKAPAKWINHAFILAMERLNNDDHSQVIITVFDKAVSKDNQRLNRLPFVPCGKVGHDWFYIEEGEPVVLTQKYKSHGRLRPEGRRGSGVNVQPSGGYKKRRPTRK